MIDETSINEIPQFNKEFKSPSPESGSSTRYSSPESRMPSRSRRSPSPPSPPSQRNGKLLKPQAKETKTSSLRAQLGPTSRSASPQPISRSQSPSIPGLPGKRKDYSRGKVYSISSFALEFPQNKHRMVLRRFPNTANTSAGKSFIKRRNGRRRRKNFEKPDHRLDFLSFN